MEGIFCYQTDGPIIGGRGLSGIWTIGLFGKGLGLGCRIMVARARTKTADHTYCGDRYIKTKSRPINPKMATL